MSLALLLGPQLSAFKAAGYEVIGASAPGPWVASLEAAGVQHVPLVHATRAWAPRRDLSALNEIRSVFRSLRPTIVHTHNPKPGIYGRLAARAVGVPVIVNTVHGLYAQNDDSTLRRGLVYGLERIAASCSQAELVQNAEDLATLSRLRVPQDRLVLLGNGVDLNRFGPPDATQRAQARAALGVPDDAVLVLAVGRLVAEKGYRELFAAAERVRATHPHVRFAVAGPTDFDKADALSRDELEAASRAGINMLGMRDDVEVLYTAADIYVLASHREGFPRSAMEAAATGLPIVATNIRGCRQVVDHDRTGLLVPRHDPATLATALSVLVGDAELRRTFGRAALDKARREFNQESVIETTLGVYERLLGARHRSASPVS